ncbi:MAG: toll/interleukin-1 receptor domain-containing protein [Rubrivivax sp.]
MTDFFISYNKADRAWAEWIAWQLEAGGHTTTIQAWDFREGGNFVLDMQRAIEGARRTVLVLSPDFLASAFTAPEWAAAFAQDPTGAQGRLLPVRVRDCRPTGLLAQIVYVDLVGLPDRAQAAKRLLAGAATGRAKPTTEPGMPAPEPGLPARLNAPPAATEPPWPPALELALDVAGSAFWRGVRGLAVTVVAALVVLNFLRMAMPEWFAIKPGAVYGMSMLWGVLVALAVEGAWRMWRRRRLAAVTRALR